MPALDQTGISLRAIAAARTQRALPTTGKAMVTEAAERNFALVARKTLCERDWQFATAYKKAEPIMVNDGEGRPVPYAPRLDGLPQYTYKAELPADALRVVDMVDANTGDSLRIIPNIRSYELIGSGYSAQRAKYAVQGRYVYFNGADVNIKYVKSDVSDEAISLWSVNFYDAVAWQLAAAISLELDGDLVQAARFEETANALIEEACAIDACDGPPEYVSPIA